uniref:porin n=1 Tax=Ferrovibrio sp. TaxID=1917215 RepID=UPI0035166F9C
MTKKTLLLQTTLAAAAGLLVAGAANAQTKEVPVGVTVGGYYTSFYKVQDRDKQAQTDQSAQALGQDAEIWFNIRGVLDNGTVVGGRVELEGTTYS